jgi:hypothetical protein
MSTARIESRKRARCSVTHRDLHGCCNRILEGWSVVRVRNARAAGSIPSCGTIFFNMLAQMQ